MILLAVLVGCKHDRCVEAEQNVTPGGATFAWRQCTDGQDRSVACEPSGAQWACTCTLGAAPGATFQLPADGMVSTRLVTGEIARDRCGWSFAP